MFELNYSYSSINTARSALSALPQNSHKTIGSHATITRFMKGVYELRTPMPKYKQIWDVAIVLRYFQTLEVNSQLNLDTLAKKLCTLLLLVSAQRLQTIHLIRVNCITFFENRCEITIIDKIKTSKPGSKNVVLKMELFEDEKLCALSTLKEYLKRTSKIRLSTDQLFLTLIKPYGPASRDTLSHWVKSILVKAGINQFGSHSCRAAASSAMLDAGVSLDEIMNSAGWQNANTFNKFYNRSQTVRDNRKDVKVENNCSILKYFKKVV